MRIAFVQNFWYEYLGVMSISGVLREDGHTTRLFISDFEKDLISSLKTFEADLVAFPVYSGSEGWVFKKAWEIKKKLKRLILLGGPHATFFPEIIKKRGVDVLCRGEGEYPTLELVKALSSGKSFENIPNLWVKKGRKITKNPVRKLISPLDKLPFLDRSLYYYYPVLQRNMVKNFSIGRGCPFACAYCHNSALKKIYQDKGSLVRFLTPDRAIKEILQVKNNYPLKVVGFIDDTFIANKLWLLKFLTLYQRAVNLPFVCNIRAELLDDRLAKKMADAGCISVFMGVESGSEKVRFKLLKKLVTDKQIITASKLLHKYKIKLAANNMVGLPGESLGEALQTIKFNAYIKTDLPWCSIFQPYIGTRLADYCLKKGLISFKDLKQIGESFQKRSVLKGQNIKELVNLHKLFHWGVWFPSLIPVIKVLVKLPLTPFYDLVFLVGQGLTYMRFYNLSFWEFVPHALNFTKFYLKRKG